MPARRLLNRRIVSWCQVSRMVTGSLANECQEEYPWVSRTPVTPARFLHACPAKHAKNCIVS